MSSSRTMVYERVKPKDLALMPTQHKVGGKELKLVRKRDTAGWEFRYWLDGNWVHVDARHKDKNDGKWVFYDHYTYDRTGKLRTV